MNDITVREVMLAGSPSQVAESIELWAWYLPRRATGTWVEKPVEITSRRDRADYSIYIKALDAPGGTAALKGRLISAPTGARLFIRGDADAWAASRTWVDALLDELRRVGWLAEGEVMPFADVVVAACKNYTPGTSKWWDMLADWYWSEGKGGVTYASMAETIENLADVVPKAHTADTISKAMQKRNPGKRKPKSE